MIGAAEATPEQAEVEPGPGVVEHNEIRRLDTWYDQVDAARKKMLPWWRTLARTLQPRRFETGETETERDGDTLRSTADIIDRTATHALRVATSGLFAGQSPPWRIWWRLAAPRRQLMELRPVRDWLDKATELGHEVMRESGFYTEIRPTYETEVGLGSGAIIIFETNDERMARCEAVPIGSYSIAQDSEGRINAFVRSMQMTLDQMVDQFGYKALSESEQEAWKKDPSETVTVRHAIREAKGKRTAFGPRRFRYAEFYWRGPQGGGRGYDGVNREVTGRTVGESGQGDGMPHVYQRGGYHEFPVVVYRWGRNPRDVFGTECPGMDALDDILTLQELREDGFKLLESMAEPPLQAPAGMGQSPISFLPGGVTRLPQGVNGRIEELYSPRPVNLEHLRVDIADVRQIVYDAFYYKAFVTVLADDRNQRATAAEIFETKRQRLTLLAPVQEMNTRYGHDLAVNRYMAIIYRRAERDWIYREDDPILPPPPRELWGLNTLTKHTSEVALAQRSEQIGAMRTHLDTQAALAAARQDASGFDTVRWDAWLQEEREILGLPESMSSSDEDVIQIREARAAQQQQAAAAAAAPGVARAARDLGESPLNEDSIIARAVGA